MLACHVRIVRRRLKPREANLPIRRTVMASRICSRRNEPTVPVHPQPRRTNSSPGLKAGFLTVTISGFSPWEPAGRPPRWTLDRPETGAVFCQSAALLIFVFRAGATTPAAPFARYRPRPDSVRTRVSTIASAKAPTEPYPVQGPPHNRRRGCRAGR